jgi:predicted DNA-binding transcriptional regulator AlpA
MRARPQKLAVTDREAAHMLSLPLSEFARLVDAGALPRPVMLDRKHARWAVKALDEALSGAKVESNEDEFET